MARCTTQRMPRPPCARRRHSTRRHPSAGSDGACWGCSACSAAPRWSARRRCARKHPPAQACTTSTGWTRAGFGPCRPACTSRRATSRRPWSFTPTASEVRAAATAGWASSSRTTASQACTRSTWGATASSGRAASSARSAGCVARRTKQRPLRAPTTCALRWTPSCPASSPAASTARASWRRATASAPTRRCSQAGRPSSGMARPST